MLNPLAPANIIARALREVGDVGANVVWEVALPAATEGGWWTLSFAGRTTNALAALAMPTPIQAALELMLGAGNVRVTGVPRGPFVISFVGELGAQPLPETLYPLTADGSNLDEPATLVAIQRNSGDSPVLAEIAQTLVAEWGEIKNADVTRLRLKVALLETLLGGSHIAIDVETAQRVEKLSQQFKNLRELLDLAMGELEGLYAASRTSAGAGAAYGGKIRKQTPNGQPYGVLTRRGVL